MLSEWGYDFRPEYRQLLEIRKRFPDVPVMALTATANIRTQLDILQQLDMKEPAYFVGNLNRPNLIYKVLNTVSKQDARNYIAKNRTDHVKDSAIIYCFKQTDTEKLSSELNEKGVATTYYHAGLSEDLKKSIYERWMADEITTVCATIAFGMGIDKVR